MALLRYADQRHLSYAEAIKEPAWAIHHALFVWSLDAEKGDKIEAERKRNQVDTQNGAGEITTEVD